MDHLRALIRRAVADRLAAIAALGGRVYRSRAYPLQSAELPGVCVYTLPESSELATHGRALERTLDIAIDIHDSASADVDERIDACAFDIESALDADPQLGGLALNGFLAGTTPGLSGEGERTTGIARLVWRVRYRTRRGAPGAPG